MSTDVYLRANSREKKTWTPFIYSFPFNADQTTERIVIYGLYSNSSLNQNKYLIEIESADLLNMLTDYNSKIADLTMQEQVVVSEIVSKRYLAGIDKLIHDEKMITEGQKISAQDAEWMAKIAALAADRAALDTMAAKVTAETVKTTAKITELEAYIATEGYQLNAVDIEIAEKEIQSSKVTIEILNAANATLKIQADTVAMATELIDVDYKIARTKIEIAGIDREIAKIDLLDNDLQIEKAQTNKLELEKPIYTSRANLAVAKRDAVQGDIGYYDTTLQTREATLKTNKKDLIDLEHTVSDNELGRKEDLQDLERTNKLAISGLKVGYATTDDLAQVAIDTAHVLSIGGRCADVTVRVNAAIQAAKDLANASIASTLIHTIGKKPT